MELAEAINVKGVVITSSPGPMPLAMRATWRAVVPLLVAIACFTPQYSANPCSNSATAVPWANCPESSTAMTAAFSSSPIIGRAMLIMAFYLVDMLCDVDQYKADLISALLHVFGSLSGRFCRNPDTARYRPLHGSFCGRRGRRNRPGGRGCRTRVRSPAHSS